VSLLDGLIITGQAQKTSSKFRENARDITGRKKPQSLSRDANDILVFVTAAG
jgi:hypothetical protein